MTFVYGPIAYTRKSYVTPGDRLLTVPLVVGAVTCGPFNHTVLPIFLYWIWYVTALVTAPHVNPTLVGLIEDVVSPVTWFGGPDVVLDTIGVIYGPLPPALDAAIWIK